MRNRGTEICGDSPLKMDTPTKTQIGTPASKSKFEDSPVFSYINSLSPIKPVKSVHITQTFTSLSFASTPSVFTSPQVSSHKESRFLRSHNSSDPKNPEFSSEDGNEANKDIDFIPEASKGEATIEPPSKNLEMELSQILKHERVMETNGTSLNKGDNGSYETEVNLQKMCNVNAKNETLDWESLICDAADLLIFSPTYNSETFRGLMQKSSSPNSEFCTSFVSQSHQNAALQTNQRQEGSSHATDNVNRESGACVPLSHEPASNLHCGTRRRCLDFEKLSGLRKNIAERPNSSSSTPNSLRCMLPCIGLHLNALAMASKDCSKTNVVHGTSHSGKIQISLPSSNAFLQSQGLVRECSTSVPGKAECESAEDGAQLAEDVSKGSACLAGEEFNPSSPKKKRHKFEQAEAGESCKRCNCKKSKCLKLYCECFAAGVYCIEPCSCIDCFNKPIHEDTVLATRKQIESRNPLAFAPKVIRSSEAVSEARDESSKTPASARHKRGCNCKKSNCLKKYCECFQGGVGCSINCRCEGCKNAFGRKDGGSVIGVEEEAERENEESQKSEMENTLQSSEIPNEEPNPALAIPSTPLLNYRPLVQLPFSSTTRPLQSLLEPGSFSSDFHNTQKYGKPDIVFSRSKLERSLESITGDEMELPDILIHSPISNIKTASPNSKRISPPHFDSSESTRGRRSGRKLILQSIPAFPSLTPQHR